MSKNTNNLTVLVTGAAGSLGAALSRECSAMGLNTIMLDKNIRGLESVWDDIVESGFQQPFLHPLDLATAGPDEAEQLISAIDSEFGKLDGLVHCAVCFKGLRPIDQVSPADWLEQIQVNLNAAWLLSVACLPLLRRSDKSFLYFLLEDIEKMNSAYWGAYGASKQALSAVVSQIAVENSANSLQVLGINPGPMASPLRADAYHAEDPRSVPDASIAAKTICRLFTGEIACSDVLVDLEKL